MYKRKLTRKNETRFFESAKVGDLFTFAYTYSMVGVRRLAKIAMVEIEYCGPDTEEYREHGAMCCKIVGRVGLPAQKA